MIDSDFQNFLDFRKQLEKLADELGLAKEVISRISFSNLEIDLRNLLLNRDYRSLSSKITDSQFNSIGYSVIPKSQVLYSFEELEHFLRVFPKVGLVFRITEDFRLNLIIGITESENNFHLKIFNNFVGSKCPIIPLHLYKLDYKSLADSIIDAVSIPCGFSMEDIILLYEDLENNIREGVIRSTNLLK